MQNLFSYPLIVDELSAATKKYHLEAAKNELPYVTEILKVPTVKSLSAELNVKLDKKNHRLNVWGEAKADIEQTSVISLDNFINHYQTEFEVEFDTKLTPQDLKEMDADIDDDVPDIILDGKINLADIAMEQIALIIDDFPRKKGEVFAFEPEFDEQEPPKQNPFAVLAQLKK